LQRALRCDPGVGGAQSHAHDTLQNQCDEANRRLGMTLGFLALSLGVVSWMLKTGYRLKA
jgi:hypothetical protein